MKNICILFLIVIGLISCDEEAQLSFIESNAIYNDNATVEINIPVAQGNSNASELINETLENHIANMLLFAEEDSSTLKLDEAIETFENQYLKFKSDFEESALVFEATFDGEVIYQSQEIITIALTGYTNTGGAHGNSNITLYNFNPKTGKTLELEDIISDEESFAKVAETHFKTEIANNGKGAMEDYFFGEDFHLPANIGFSEEGVLLLYNPYEVAAYAMGITEITILFEEVHNFLKIN